MGRLIDVSNIIVKPQYIQDIMGIATIRCEDLPRILADAPTVEAIPKVEYEARLKELISMAVRVKHNTGSIDLLIDILDILLSEVIE